jgi:hypothetical protein
MAKRKPRRAKAAKAAAKKSTRSAKSRKSTGRRVSAKRPSARKTTRKAAKKKTRQLVARKTAKSIKRAAKKKAAKKRRAPAASTRAIGIAPVQPAPAKAAKAVRAPRLKRAPTLDRARKTVDASTGSGSSRAKPMDEAEPHGVPSSLDLERPPSAARSGRKELSERLKQHTSTGPAITAGDVDANWEDAETVGDEAPGGDNPTPDQDVVEDIGRALGVQYDDDEELKGGDEIASRDRHRWELDPASSDDFDERD